MTFFAALLLILIIFAIIVVWSFIEFLQQEKEYKTLDSFNSKEI